MVNLKDVRMSYPGSDKDVLQDIDLTIEDGEFVFLVGASGSGKTTIIKLLTGEVTATGGSLEVNGFDLRRIKHRQLPRLRRTLGVIFQDFRLIQDRMVYENVAFAMRVLGAGSREIKKRVPEVLELVGLTGCEQQRVTIARALVNNPSMIIADEPTGNLDPSRSLEIMLLLEKINEMGTTVLVVTHEKELVDALDKRVVALRDGRLVSGGNGYYAYVE